MSATLIQELVERLRNAHPDDSKEQRDIFERIRVLRSDFEAPLDPEALRCLEAAGMLVSFLARMGGMAGPDVLAIAVRLLDGALQAEVESGGSVAAPSTGHPSIRKKAHPAGLASSATPAPPASPIPSEEPTATATDLMGEMMLGQILLHRGFVLEEHIHQAMRIQRSSPAKIGDIFVKMGACSNEQLNEALSHQASLRRVREILHEPAPKAPEQRPPDVRGIGLKLVGEALLGETLVERSVVTRRQLERALEAQKRSGMRIGDALVEMGATTVDEIEQAMHSQGRQQRFSSKIPQKSQGRDDGR